MSETERKTNLDLEVIRGFLSQDIVKHAKLQYKKNIQNIF